MGTGTGEHLWGTTWAARPIEMTGFSAPELTPEIYVPDVSALRFGPFDITLECPDCHPKLKVCFCDSTLTDGCSATEDFSIEVGVVAWSGLTCALDDAHLRPDCSRIDGSTLVCT